jgi:hypothetical protein
MPTQLERYRPVLLLDSREREHPRIYGRVAREGQEAFLTYWIYFAADWSPPPWRTEHAHNWEYAQLQLVGPDSIGSVAIAQHSSGERRRWHQVRWTPDLRPIFYVGLGKHALRFEPGWHRTGPTDICRANGKGERIDPVLEPCPLDGWSSQNFGRIVAPGLTTRWHRPSSWAASLG